MKDKILSITTNDNIGLDYPTPTFQLDIYSSNKLSKFELCWLWVTGRLVKKEKRGMFPYQYEDTRWEMRMTRRSDIVFNVYTAPFFLHRWAQYVCFGVVWKLVKR